MPLRRAESPATTDRSQGGKQTAVGAKHRNLRTRMIAVETMREPAGWAGLGVGQVLASLMLIWTIVRQYFPDFNHRYFRKHTDRVVGLVYPYIQITFPEITGQGFRRSEAYTAIEAYLATICTVSAKRFRADIGKDSTKLSLSMDDAEEVHDEFMGAKVWWASDVVPRKSPGYFSLYATNDEQRFYRLTFHRRHRDLVNDRYLAHVMEKGREARVTRRQRKLYTNNPTGAGYYSSSLWSHVPFEHPATFDTIAMDPQMKREIVDDLITFRGNKNYYTKIGRAWKRGYLLYGPPGTGKSSMVAAMANLLDYDVYDVELTAVANNTALRKLLIETSSKSVIVIEDIDCSLDLTGKRKKKTNEDNKEGGENKPPPPPEMEERKDSKVTLSGLLNFIDGLWSACGGEKLIVFTTNHIEKLDDALIRKGRMDKHIELSYCCFEAFKLLAKNYLDIHSHPLFQQIREKIDESKITPADVAECLMPKVQGVTEEDITKSLESLLLAMKESKEKAIKEAEEAAAAKAEAATSPAASYTTDTAATADKTPAPASASVNTEENNNTCQIPQGEKKAEANGGEEIKS